MGIFIMQIVFEGLWLILRIFNYGNFEKIEGNNTKLCLGVKK